MQKNHVVIFIINSFYFTKFFNYKILFSILFQVILILTTGETLRQILLAAFDLQMGNGGYVFLTVELFKHANSFGNFDWFVNNDTRNDVSNFLICLFAFGLVCKFSLMFFKI